MNALIESTPDQTSQSLVALGTLQADTPKALVTGATAIANELAQLIRTRKLAVNIQGREFVKVEGWTVLGALLGVIAREESVIEREDGSYLATIQLVRMKDDVIVSRGSAECGMDEPTWANRPKYARRSMALTRATGKASRLAFSWIMALAGYEPTPAEEMPRDGESQGAVVPSGKYRNRAWEDVPADYLSWTQGVDSKASPSFKALAKVEIERRAKGTFGTPEKIETDETVPF
jgi:hypothetical protein